MWEENFFFLWGGKITSVGRKKKVWSPSVWLYCIVCSLKEIEYLGKSAWKGLKVSSKAGDWGEQIQRKNESWQDGGLKRKATEREREAEEEREWRNEWVRVGMTKLNLFIKKHDRYISGRHMFQRIHSASVSSRIVLSVITAHTGHVAVFLFLGIQNLIVHTNLHCNWTLACIYID